MRMWVTVVFLCVYVCVCITAVLHAVVETNIQVRYQKSEIMYKLCLLNCKCAEYTQRRLDIVP